MNHCPCDKTSCVSATTKRVITYLYSISDALLLLFARIFIGMIFWQSGRTKMDGWQINENAIYLFQDEYRLPLIDPVFAASAAAFAEHIFPALLFLGLATRFASLALLGVTAVIQFFVYPDAWATHGTWATILTLLLLKGGGVGSVDHWIIQRIGWERNTRPTCN